MARHEQQQLAVHELIKSTSSMFNGTLVVYDPYNKTTKVVDLPGISHAGDANYTEFHLDGIDYDSKSGNIFISAASAVAFDSVIVQGPGGTISTDYSLANYTGDNRIVIFDPKNEAIVADVSLLPAQEQYRKAMGGNLTNAFQDMAEVASTGDSYAVGTFGNSIVRIPYGSKESELWYAPPASNYSKEYGFGGLFASGNKLVVSDTLSGGMVTFDTLQKNPVAKHVPLRDLPDDYKPANADGLFLPSKYGGKVALWSDDYNGTSVYGSEDYWDTARFLGLISNDDPGQIQGGSTTASFEIGKSVYVLTQIFQFSVPVKPKKNFLFYDITTQLDAIVKDSFVSNGTMH